MSVSIYQQTIDTLLQYNAPPVWVHEKFLYKLLPPAGESTSKREILSQSIKCLRNGCIGPKKDKKHVIQGPVNIEEENKYSIRMKKHGTAEQFPNSSLSDSTSIISIPCWFYWDAYPIIGITSQLNIARCCMGER